MAVSEKALDVVAVGDAAMDEPFSVVWGALKLANADANGDGWVLSGKCIGRQGADGEQAHELAEPTTGEGMRSWWTGAVGGQVRTRIVRRLAF